MADVRDSFRNVAANYSRSTFHASSIRLQEVVDLVQPKPGDLALDVATGTGNTAFALAPHVRRVVGLDLTREMLNEGRRIAGERSITNVEWVIGDAANEASRLTDEAKQRAGRVLVSHHTVAAADATDREWIACGELALRGRPAPTVVYEPA